MTTDLERASALQDDLIKSLFHCTQFAAAWSSIFPVRPNERGLYAMATTADKARTALEYFRQYRDAKLWSPNVLREWLDTWATTLFVAEAHWPHPEDFHKFPQYDPTTDVMMFMEIVYTDEHDAVKRPWMMRVASSPMSPDEVDERRRGNIGRMLAAGAPPEFITALMNTDLTGYDPTSAESKEAAEKILRNRSCRRCRSETAHSKCSQCKMARYCNRECQVADWPEHKKTCGLEKFMGEMLVQQAQGSPNFADVIVHNVNESSRV